MSDKADVSGAFVIGAIVGLGVAMFIAVLTCTDDNVWHQEAVDHGAAIYHPETSDFTWMDEYETVD